MKVEEYRKDFMVLPFSLIINNNAENILEGFIKDYKEIIQTEMELKMVKLRMEI